MCLDSDMPGPGYAADLFHLEQPKLCCREELGLPTLGSVLSEDCWLGRPDLDVLASQPNNPVQTVLIF